MKTEFKTGDIVCHKAEFLRSVGWYTNVPINGKILAVCPPGSGMIHWKTPTQPEPVMITKELVMVQWNNQKEPTLIRASNLILYAERHLEPA